MSAEHDLDVAQQLGHIQATLENMDARLVNVDTKVDTHIAEGEIRLRKVEYSLSLARFTVLFLKAIALTILFVFAWKFGDIKSLWTALK
mgnify:CR=1 FL=1